MLQNTPSAENWTLPAALDTPLPRQVAMTGIVLAAFVWGAIALVLFVCFLAGMAALQFQNQSALQDRGIDITGIVRTLRTVVNKGNKGYLLGYRYDPAELARSATPVVVDERGVSAAQYAMLRIGQRIPVLYDPQVPDHSSLNFENAARRESPWVAAKVAGIAALGVTALGLIFAAFLRHAWLWEKHLLQWGQAAPATILAEAEYHTRSGRRSKLTYRFRDVQGRTVKGTRYNVPLKGSRRADDIDDRRDILANPTVLFDPHNSGKHMLYPTSMVRVR